MLKATVLTGLAPYQDPWHGLEATSAVLAELLEEWGFSVSLSDDLERILRDGADLLVVNLAGRGSEPDPGSEANERALATILARRIPVLALHSSAIAFAGSPMWRRVIGGRWEPGRSGHPQIGSSVIHVVPGHPLVEGLSGFQVYDERYSRLTRDAGVALIAHVEDGVRHELGWALEEPGGRRAVYDGLGHGAESYDSAARRELLRREVCWLVRSATGS